MSILIKKDRLQSRIADAVSRSYWVLVLASVIQFSLSCDKDSNPTNHGGTNDPQKSELGTFLFTATDEYNNPIEGVRVRLSIQKPWPPTNTDADSLFETDVLTDEHGKILMTDLMLGHCQYTTVPEGYEGVYNYIKYSGLKVDFQAGDTLQATCVFPKDPVSLRINLTGSTYNGGIRENIPLPDVSMVLKDVNNVELRGTTDAGGEIQFNHIDPSLFASGFTGTLQREESLREFEISGGFDFENGMATYWLSVYGSADIPVIYTPEMNAVFAGTRVHFTGYGYDFEDGVLSDSSLVWISSIDGTLGYGQEITTDLRVGFHRISLQALDTGQRASHYPGGNGLNGTQKSISITVSHYETESYFPIPVGGYWDYQLDPITFALVNEWNETEQWIHDTMSVAVESYDTRVCTMQWTVDKDGTKATCEYVLKDSFDFDGSAISITSTEELLTVYDNPEMTGTPVEKLKVVTSYEPSHQLLGDFRDPVAAGHVSVDITASSSITNTLGDVGSHTFNQQAQIVVTYDPDAPVTLATPSGTFETMPVCTQIGGIERTMYLAPGVGVVQLDTDIAGTPVTASLVETNMESFAPVSRVARIAESSSKPIVMTLDANEDQLLQIVHIMRGICPL